MPLDLQGTAYEVHGPDDAPVVVLIHGLGLTRGSTWREFIPVLAVDYRVVAYDLCGHGQSDLPPRKPDLTVLSEQLLALLDHLKIEKAALVGFSLGGMINRRFAMDNPERASSLVVLNSPHERSPEQQVLVEKRAKDTSSSGPAANLDVTLERWFTAGFRKEFPAKVQQVRDVVLANEPTNYAAHREVLATGVIELIRPEPPISIPTLVVTCENDSGSTPAMSRAIAKDIEGAEVIVVPDLQHLGLVEQPQLFCGLVENFLIKTSNKEH